MADGKKSTLPTFSVFYGAVINPISLKKCEKHPRALIFVNHRGDIVWMCDEVAPEDLSRTIEQKVAGFKAEDGDETRATFDVTILQDREFIIPGFVDTHTVGPSELAFFCDILTPRSRVQHAPQVPNMGRWVPFNSSRRACSPFDFSFPSGGDFTLLKRLQCVTFIAYGVSANEL